MYLLSIEKAVEKGEAVVLSSVLADDGGSVSDCVLGVITEERATIIDCRRDGFGRPAGLLNSSGVYINKSVVNGVRHGNYI